MSDQVLMDRERREGVSYTGRRLIAVIVALISCAVVLGLWWRVASLIAAHVIGGSPQSAGVWLVFVGVPLLTVYVIHRVLEEMRGE